VRSLCDAAITEPAARPRSSEGSSEGSSAASAPGCPIEENREARPSTALDSDGDRAARHALAARHPWQARPMEAQLSGRVRGDEQLCGWLASGGLDGVEALIAWDAALTDRAAHAICEAAPDALASIDLSWNHVGADGAGALAALRGLLRLRLYHNEVGPDGAAAIARRARPLQGLNLCGNRLGDDGAQALCSWRLAALGELALGWNDIGDGGAQALAAGVWPDLEVLNLRANRLGPEGAAAVMALPALRRLGLDENPLGNAGLAALAAAPAFPRLVWLNLGGTGLDDGAVDALLAARPAALRELRVHDNELGPEACAALRRGLPDCEVIA
jgi:hypothetical protein